MRDGFHTSTPHTPPSDSPMPSPRRVASIFFMLDANPFLSCTQLAVWPISGKANLTIAPPPLPALQSCGQRVPGSTRIVMDTSIVRESTLGDGSRGEDPRIMHTAMLKNHDIHDRYSQDSHTRHRPASGAVSSQLPKQVRGLALIPVIRLFAWCIDRGAPRTEDLLVVALGMWISDQGPPHIIRCHILDLHPLFDTSYIYIISAYQTFFSLFVYCSGNILGWVILY
jgi:hypothetical protein